MICPFCGNIGENIGAYRIYAAVSEKYEHRSFINCPGCSAPLTIPELRAAVKVYNAQFEEKRYNHNHDSKGRFCSGSGTENSAGSVKGIDNSAKGAILEGGYNPEDIKKAITQESTNFVTKDINNPESLYGELIDKVPAQKGFYDIKCHGSPDSVKIFDSVIDADELAKIIIMRKDYNNQPIRLLSCETGKGNNCIAQKLSDLLGVSVLAPTEVIWAKSSGDYEVGTDKGKQNGMMKTFIPKKR